MKKMRKGLSLVLALILVLSVMPEFAFAAEAGSTTNGSYSNGSWLDGGTGSVTHNVDGTEVTLSKTATPVAGMENTYDITLQVKTSTSTSVVTNSGAVVLVIDVSGSMRYCAECGGDGYHNGDCDLNTSGNVWFGSRVKDSESRMKAAKTAALNFLASYAGTDSAAKRQLSIVVFADGYSVKMDWENVAGGAGKNSYNQAVNTINNLSADGGTNLEGGLYTALNQIGEVDGTKSVVLLTDGVPTYRIGGGNGSSGSQKNNDAAAKQATDIKKAGATLYTVCFGVANENTYNGGPTVGNFLRDSVASSGCAYNADNSEELNNAFAAITESITSGLSGDGWTATDPMAQGITVISGAGENFVSDGNGTYTWKLTDAQTQTIDNVTYYVYTYTYRVTFDPQFKGFVEGEYYPTNKETYLNIDGAQYAFPVPGITGVLPRTDVTVTKEWDDNNNQDGKRPDSITVQLMEGERDIGDPVVLNADNNWSYTWDGETYDLIAKSEGVDRVYTVVETDVPDGYKDFVSTNGFAITLTNTHTPETIDILVEKVWDDADNQDGKRPDEITVNLLADGTEVASKTVTAEDGWAWSFTDLPKYSGGVEIVYTVTEDAVADYTTTVNGYNITNTHVPETTEVSGSKTWDDADNQDGKRPASITVNLLADDVKVDSVTVTAADDWAWSFTGLDKYKNGVEIEYTVSEEAVDGYIPSYNGFDITNTHTPETIEIEVTKVWNDNNDQDGKRPASITVNLLANGEVVKTATVTGDSWKHTFENLPKYEAGKEIVYTVEEVEVDGYTSDVKGYIITNTHEIEKTSVTVNKVWDDANNQDGVRPTSITVNLLADGEVLKTATVTADNNWTYTFADLDVYKAGKEIVYTVDEVTVPTDYTKAVTGDAANGYTITNSYTPETTKVTVTKEWVDNDDQDGVRPESITVQLHANGEAYGDPVVIKADENGNWTYTWTDLDKYYNQGELVKYTVSEDKVEGYTTTIDGLKIINTHEIIKTSVSGTKTWADDNDRDGIRPESITVNLLADGKIVDSAVVTAESGWTYEFTDLDMYRDGGIKIEYTVTEDAVSGYKTSISGTNIINKHTPKTTNITVTKSWSDDNNRDGLRPSSVLVQLYANGEAYGDPVRVYAVDGWTYTWEGLYLNENGQKIVYTVKEVGVPEGYTASVDGLTITNTHEIEKTSVSGSKIWSDDNDRDGIRPESITVNLLADGTVIASQTVTAEADWSYEFTNLPKYRDGGIEIVYTVTEDEVEGYDTTIDGYNITNTHAPEQTEVTVTKTWVDNEDQDGIRPESITVNLLADGTVIASQTVTAEADWTYKFIDLPKYRDGGVEIVYTVTENAVSGYETTIDGTDITNTHAPETIDILVEKVWNDADNQDGIRPEQIVVAVYADGSEEYVAVRVVEADENGNWSCTFEDLPKYRDHGTEIVYTVKEGPVEGYSAEIVDGEDGYNVTITNTHEVEKTEFTATKIWADDDNRDGIRPESITVNLLANGEVIDTVEITADENGDWTYTWTDLDKYYNQGELVVYTVTEEVVEGYTTTINGGVITNTHEAELTEVTVTKTWDDNDDQDGIRPESVVVNLLANGEIIDSAVVTAEDGWTYTFEDLYVYEDGAEIVYTVEEVEVDGYTATIDGYEITNTHEIEMTEFTVTKIWADDDNRDGLRPDAIKVQLYANGEPCGTVVKITADANGDWTYTWTDLDKYYNQGELVVYTVAEVDVNEDYTAEVVGNVIVNTHEIATVDMKVDKVWAGEDESAVRPDSITIQLYANGVAVGDSVKITAENGWTYTFTDLPVYEAGEAIAYTVVETAVEGYDTTYTVNETGITITNMYKVVPATGDNANTMMWTAIFVIGLGLLGMALIPEKKKYV